MKKIIAFSILLMFLLPQLASQSIPNVTVTIKDGTGQKGELTSAIKLMLLFTLLTLAPAILMLMTAFTRIIVSFHFLRQAMGLQGIPPNQVIIGITLFLTLYIMTPVGLKINETAIKPLNEGKITEMEALQISAKPLKTFMLNQTREKDLQLFYDLSRQPHPKNRNEVDMLVLLPAFVLSELKTAFQIGFLIYIPFLIIDVVVASILVSLGMIFLPPAMISLPFKVILFILADGWFLLISSLLKSFRLGGL